MAGQCPFPDFYNPLDGNCYSAVHLSAPWTLALVVCKLVGGEIVTPQSGFEDSMFAQYAQDSSVDWAWLGARVTVFNKVISTEGKLLDYSKWAPGQPNRKTGNCVKMSSDSYWYTEQCGKSIRFFCKYQPTLPTTVEIKTVAPTEGSSTTTVPLPIETETELQTTEKAVQTEFPPITTTADGVIRSSTAIPTEPEADSPITATFPVNTKLFTTQKTDSPSTTTIEVNESSTAVHTELGPLTDSSSTPIFQVPTVTQTEESVFTPVSTSNDTDSPVTEPSEDQSTEISVQTEAPEGTTLIDVSTDLPSTTLETVTLEVSTNQKEDPASGMTSEPKSSPAPTTVLPRETTTVLVENPATAPLRTEAPERSTVQTEGPVATTSPVSISEPKTDSPTTTVIPSTKTTVIVANVTVPVPTTAKPQNCPRSHKGCPRGFVFNSKTCACYLLTHNTMNWNQAENHCRKQKAHLASIHSRNEAKFITNLVSLPGHLLHVGLQYQSRNGWTWSDGSINDYNDFAPHQPIGSLAVSGCGALYGNGFFHSSYLTNQPCSSFYLHAVCKMPLV